MARYTAAEASPRRHSSTDSHVAGTPRTLSKGEREIGFLLAHRSGFTLRTVVEFSDLGIPRDAVNHLRPSLSPKIPRQTSIDAVTDHACTRYNKPQTHQVAALGTRTRTDRPDHSQRHRGGTSAPKCKQPVNANTSSALTSAGGLARAREQAARGRHHTSHTYHMVRSTATQYSWSQARAHGHRRGPAHT